MTRSAMLWAALLLGAPATAQVQLLPLPGIEGPPSDEAAAAAEAAREQVQECAGQKFVFAWGAGARPTRVTLCSEAGATTQEVVRMLEDAVAKIEASSIPEDRRTAIVQQMRSKIAELKGEPGAASPPASATAARSPAPAPAIAQPAPRPAPPVAQPAPRPAPVRTAPAVAAAQRPAQPKPRLAFECYTPGEIGSGGPCTTLARETRLTVKARDPLPAGSSIRFVRNGDLRGELALRAMRKGQATTLTLPREVCSGVVEAETRIEVVRAGVVLDTAGPYLLRC